MSERKKWTEDDVVNSDKIVDFQISPDSKWVVWVKASPDDDKGERVGHLFRSPLDSKKEVQLTRGTDPCVHPRCRVLRRIPATATRSRWWRRSSCSDSRRRSGP